MIQSFIKPTFDQPLQVVDRITARIQAELTLDHTPMPYLDDDMAHQIKQVERQQVVAQLVYILGLLVSKVDVQGNNTLISRKI